MATTCQEVMTLKTVLLYGKHADGRVVLVDDEDYPLISRYRWRAKLTVTRNRTITYAYTSHGPRHAQKSMFMHNLIMGRVGIDHRDHDGLNNQRSNLRPATGSQNNANGRPRPGTSRFRGVHWYGKKSRWQAQIKVNGRSRGLGYFDAEEDAARVYDAAALEAWGEFATQNFPEGAESDG